jgi:DNA-binding Xre family transcriptional regulator
MIRYKINVADALERVGFNTYKAKTSGLLSQDTLKKLKNEDTTVSLKSINSLCVILDMELKDIIYFTMSEEEKKEREKII